MEDLLVSEFYAKAAESIFIPVSTVHFTIQMRRDADLLPQKLSVIEKAEISVRSSFPIQALYRERIRGKKKPLNILMIFSVQMGSETSMSIRCNRKEGDERPFSGPE